MAAPAIIKGFYRNFDAYDSTYVSFDLLGPIASIPNLTDVFPSIEPSVAATFLGWNTSSNGNGDWYYADDPLPAGPTGDLYAIYGSSDSATFYRNLNSNDTINVEDTSGIFPDPSIVFDDVILIFSEWNTARDGSGSSYAIGDTYSGSDNVYYAIYDAPVSYSATDGEFTYLASKIRKLKGFNSALSWPLGYGRALDNDVAADIIGRTISGEYANRNVINIGYGAFAGCVDLTSVNFPECTTVHDYAFSGCTGLITANISKCTVIGASAFHNCGRLLGASFPYCVTIYNYVFMNCAALSFANFPLCKIINGNAFFACHSLNTISFPKCYYIGISAFYNCSSMTVVSFPECQTISSYAFYGCRKLKSIYLMSNTLITLSNSNAFTSTPIAGYSIYNNNKYGSIYVPASMLASYKTRTNWTYFSNRMVGV